MKTVGIIAEYDPFHCGHAFHLNAARKEADADYVIVVMSPDFLQRGEPALIDKWIRARMALEAGADLVLELPVRSAAGSAEYFAKGGVRLLDSLGCVDALSFGCEAADAFGLLEKAAHFFAKPESAQYRGILRQMLKCGASFPSARAQAFLSLETSSASGGSILPAGLSAGHSISGAHALRTDEIMDMLSRPNNILAVEYMKAAVQLGSSMKMIPVRRLGDYHQSIDPAAGEYASATRIRSALLEHGMTLPEWLRPQLPPSSLTLLEGELQNGRFVVPGDLDLLLHKELLDKREQLAEYVDIDQDLANRINRFLNQYTGFAQFAALVKSRQYTLTRIRRALLHVLLGIRKDTAPVSCARVLGFRKEAQPLLHRISRHASIPLSTKLPFSMLSGEDIQASHLWEMVLAHKTHKSMRHERRRRIIIL